MTYSFSGVFSLKIREHVHRINGDVCLGNYDSYRMGRLLGSGGSARVYEVMRSHHIFAMKVPLTVDISGAETCYSNYDPNLLDEYMSEARVWAELSEKVPNSVVRLIDYNTKPFVWAVMEKADYDLESAISRGEVDEYELVPLLYSLQSIHNVGVVHRDLKPQNILSVEGEWKFADFGLSKRIGSLTVTSSGNGTPYYLAPEQVDTRLGPTDCRTDIWQMGIILYRIVTGCMPYTNSDRNGVMFSILSEGPDTSIVPAKYRAVVSKALARRKQDRYQTALEFADALASVTGHTTYDDGMSLYLGLGSMPDYIHAYSVFSAGTDVKSVCMTAILELEGKGTDKDELAAKIRIRKLGEGIKSLDDSSDSFWICAFLAKEGLIILDSTHTVESLLIDACVKGSVVAPCLLYEEDPQADNPWLIQAAKKGYTRAMVDLGVALHTGEGRPRSDDEAFEWFHRAVKQGSPNACDCLAVMYADSNYPDSGYKAKQWVDRAIDMGSNDAYNTLGYMYMIGIGVPQSYTKAVEMFEAGAERNSYPACYDLGCMYDKGLGVEQSYDKAAEMYTKAMAGKHWEAYYALSLLYKEGKGVEKSSQKAIDLCEKAAENGVEAAKLAMSIYYVEGKYVKRDTRKAVNIMEEVADAGNVEIQKYLGDIYTEGDLVPKSLFDAYKWYRRASDSGDADAKYEIGRMYEKGIYLRPSKGNAAFMYREASQLGSKKAAEALRRIGKN